MSRAIPQEISLCDLGLVQGAIIVEHDRGFLYSNQTHHHDCRHSEAIGYLLPLDLHITSGCWDCMDDEATYRAMMKGLPLMPPQKMVAHIESSVAKAARDVLANFEITAHPQNGEAWLRCTFRSPVLSGPGDADDPLVGWLTWGNCD